MDTCDKISIIIRMQNINLLKYIAWCEECDYIELCKKYIR